ncbi:MULTISPECIES: hypothetical protein [Amycolatopsis]|uniref:Uncharacterized protein n=1 Tax=Amycolatopsis saalfeldensis TaxID=394193 RepID=A0A1H8YNE2_9PSEU|nr:MULTISPECIES: hypothetical protein [Amycolatopsis]SEP53679.1 hypothetical protein SAMN04489732_129125 [Amycolatopsis saalfeldensis]
MAAPKKPPARQQPTTKRGRYLIRIDYSSTCAHVLDLDNGRRVIESYGPGVVRHTVEKVIASGGWVLTPPTNPESWVAWVDGREHPIHQRG